MAVQLLLNPEKLDLDDFVPQEDKIKDPNTGEETSASTNFQWDWEPRTSKKKGGLFAYGDETLMIFSDCKIWQDSNALKDKDAGKALLAHEQLHWDVIHAIGRVLVHKLEALTAKTVADLDAEAKRLLEYHFLRRGPLIHKAYDKETNHGLDQDNQKLWAGKITRMLANKNSLMLDGWWL